MRTRHWIMAALILALVVGGGGVMAAALWASAEPEARHTPLHVKCQHHKHGAAWHANHGRMMRDAQEAARKARAERSGQ